jgi:hypothetical protein
MNAPCDAFFDEKRLRRFLKAPYAEHRAVHLVQFFSRESSRGFRQMITLPL